MRSRGRLPAPVPGIKVTHALFALQFCAFLVMVIGSGTTAWHEPAVAAFSVGGLDATIQQPWTLVTHAFINLHPLEFVVAAGVLLLAGVPVEERLGRRRFLLLYALAAALVALAHVALLELGVVEAPRFAGSMGASAGVLTAYLFLLGEERQVGNVPFPVFYVICCSFLFLILALVDYHNGQELEKDRQQLLGNAYTDTNTTPEERLANLEQAGLVATRRHDMLTHMLGLMLGALSLLSTRVMVRAHERYRVLREIRVLQEEVDARARVELLLEKINRGGMASLTRNERKFLRYASRFYRSRSGEPV